MSDKVYVVTATYVDKENDVVRDCSDAIYVNKTWKGAENNFLSWLEDFYGKGELEEIRERYPKEFESMLKRGFYNRDTMPWSNDYDEEAYSVASNPLKSVFIEEKELGE